LSYFAAKDWNIGGHAEGGAHHHHPGDILPHSVRHVLYIRLQLREEANSRSQNYTGQCHEMFDCAEMIIEGSTSWKETCNHEFIKFSTGTQ
jgi:hypothetical protein